MLYQHKITGGIVEKISQHGEGVSMVINAQDETEYVNDEDLIPCVQATGEKIKTEERLKAELDRNISYDKAKSIALKASLIPITNSLFAVGLVSLPGMMTGQILSGISPHIAIRYQIMVMCMIFSAVGLSSYLFLTFSKNK